MNTDKNAGNPFRQSQFRNLQLQFNPHYSPLRAIGCCQTGGFGLVKMSVADHPVQPLRIVRKRRELGSNRELVIE
jgi:hypothetical protein